MFKVATSQGGEPEQVGDGGNQGTPNGTTGMPASGGLPAQDKPAESAHQHLLRDILAGDSTALSMGFTRLRAVEGTEAQQLEAALTQASSRAKSLPSILALLGDGNGFLHSPGGRKLARRAAKRFRELPAEREVEQVSRLLQRCMRGSIAKSDSDAATLVDELYARQLVLVNQVVFNPSRLDKARSYTVRSGDNLDAIASRFRKQGIQIEGWTLCIVNRIGRPSRLQAGKTIKIPIEPFRVHVERRSFLMAVYLGDIIVRLYWVGLGREGHETPVATFTVQTKQPNPDWYSPNGGMVPFGHPDNPLGRFFVKFGHASLTGFGAHGTAVPATIRTRASNGCIRMRDADILEFFHLVPRRTKVSITDNH